MYEFEVWLATHDQLRQGIIAGVIRKVLVGACCSTEAYKIVLDMSWREPYQVTKMWYVA